MAHDIVYPNNHRATRAISSIFFGRVFHIKVDRPGAGKKTKSGATFGTYIVVRKIPVLCIAFFADGYKHVTHLCLSLDQYFSFANVEFAAYARRRACSFNVLPQMPCISLARLFLKANIQ